MEKRFQEQIQRIRNINKSNSGISKNQQKEVEFNKKIKDRQEQELKRFYEYVQNNFIEYILNLLEHCTKEYGDIIWIDLHERQSRIANPKLIKEDLSPLNPFTNKKYSLKNYHWVWFDVYTEHNGRKTLETELDFSTLYRKYKPQEDFAHVIIPNSQDPNFYSFKLDESDIILCINDLNELFQAVTVNYKYTTYHDTVNIADSGTSTTLNCDLDNEIKIALVTNSYGIGDESSTYMEVGLIK